MKKETTNLHLNVQDHDLALGRLLLDGGLARAVAVAAKLGMLDEAVLGNQGLKVIHGHKVVVHAILLALARLAGRVRDGEGKGVGVLLEEPAVEGALADARRAGDDKGAAVGGRSCERRERVSAKLRHATPRAMVAQCGGGGARSDHVLGAMVLDGRAKYRGERKKELRRSRLLVLPVGIDNRRGMCVRPERRRSQGEPAACDSGTEMQSLAGKIMETAAEIAGNHMWQAVASARLPLKSWVDPPFSLAISQRHGSGPLKFSRDGIAIFNG
jgi:hypothetical protein